MSVMADVLDSRLEGTANVHVICNRLHDTAILLP